MSSEESLFREPQNPSGPVDLLILASQDKRAVKAEGADAFLLGVG